MQPLLPPYSHTYILWYRAIFAGRAHKIKCVLAMRIDIFRHDTRIYSMHIIIIFVRGEQLLLLRSSGAVTFLLTTKIRKSFDAYCVRAIRARIDNIIYI